MPSNTLIGDWASGFWTNLGQPVNVAVTTISGYAIQPNTLGQLNSFIGTCYSGSGYLGVTGTSNFDTDPNLTNTELSIIGAMYLVSYYNSLSQAMMGVSQNTIPWVNLKEGDSTITRANGANLGMVYAKMATDANTRLQYLVNAYRQNAQGGSVPRTVDYPNIQYPEFGITYASF